MTRQHPIALAALLASSTLAHGATRVSVSLSPASASLVAGGTLPFTATVSGTSNKTVKWSTSDGTIAASGVYTAPQTPGSYTVTATSAQYPTKSATAVVKVTAPTAPKISAFAAAPASIASGGSATLSWTVSGASGLSLAPGIGAVSGTSITISPAQTTTYTLTASNSAGKTTASTTVTVTPPSPPAISAFTASPSTFAAGQSTTLSWAVSGAASLSIAPGVGTVTGTSLSLSPSQSTTYTLTATNGGGSATATATVTVTAATSTLNLTNPILFVTQVPHDGFATISLPFANHLGTIGAIPRGGDLWIRYPDGSMRNLTAEAGFGTAGFQDDTSIAVREPSVHWSGTKAVFAMAVGSPKQYVYEDRFWQLYEITGLGKGETAVITKVAGQPQANNNISPIYGTDDRIIFASDRPRGGEPHLYPQLDEYESTPTLTGLWSLLPTTGDLKLLNHAPSGAFQPTLDSYGRILFTKWDHLQRDQQADADATENAGHGSFNYGDETSTAARLDSIQEVFPEPRLSTDPENLANHVNGFTFNQFFPWQLTEDGRQEETLNHVGRHEIGGFYVGEPSFNDDPNLSAYAPESYHTNRNYLGGFGGIFGLREDPRQPGVYYATNMGEFNSGRAGQIVTLNGAPSTNPDAMNVTWITAPITRDELQPGDPVPPDATGRYRNPLPTSDGLLLASHTPEAIRNENAGTTEAPNYPYHFRLKSLLPGGTYFQPGQLLTPGIQKSVSWYSPDVLVSYSGELWELDPVEVVARPRPAAPDTTQLAAPEKQSFTDAGVDETSFRSWLKANDLALIVSRNVTLRDQADVQQPFNLFVPGGVSSIAMSGKSYESSFLQLFQADQVRGYGGTSAPRPGRRVLPKPMHDGLPALNPGATAAPQGGTQVGQDGSVAALVPARRAMTWQLTDGTGKAVVRERNWVSFQSGEIRVCASCHGINSKSQMGTPAPTNVPSALTGLLKSWKAYTTPTPSR